MSEVSEELGERISELEIWGIQFERLATRVEFEKYGNAVEFVNEVFDLVDDHEHYPRIKVERNHVDIDVGDEKIGEEDLDLAEDIERKLKDMSF